MRTLLVLTVMVAMAYSLSVQDIDFSSLIQEGTSQNDAVQSVYNLLNDLKQANLEAQLQSDERNTSDEEIGGHVITELTKIHQLNVDTFSKTRAQREWVDNEYKNAGDYIVWAQGRIAEIDRRSTELEEFRCFSNGLFVRSIKQHQDALGVIRLLKQDVSGYLTGSLAEIKVENVADKLKMYSTLFNQKAMEQFVELASGTDYASGGAELHAQGQDEQFNGTGAGAGGAGGKTAGDTVGQQVYNLLVDLEQQLGQSLSNLEQSEIAAAYQLADWLGDSEAEKINLNQEIEKATKKQEKLWLAHLAALAQLGKAESVLRESQAAIDQAIADLQEKRAFWQEEFDRRNEENAIIDEIIHIFKNQVKNVASKTSLGRK